MTPRMCRTGWITSTRRISSSSSTTTTAPISTASSTPLFGQRDVTVTTDGYNYIAIGDDVYMYTGITSVVSDQSNIGFILSNQRTKETRFYSVAGAEEYSAMDSARGQVQQMNYTATFPCC